MGTSNRRKDTAPELALRSALHRRGHRFRKDHYLRVPGVRVHVDVAFTRRRLAVFVDGCFWHSCPDHGSAPRSNTAYWSPKLEANRARDRRVDHGLAEAGWTVLRIWEHEEVPSAVAAVETILSGLALRR